MGADLPSEHSEQYLGTFLVVTISDTVGIYVRPGRLPNTLQCTQHIPTTKNHPAPNVIDAEENKDLP